MRVWNFRRLLFSWWIEFSRANILIRDDFMGVYI
jgi:hypothetical protein